MTAETAGQLLVNSANDDESTIEEKINSIKTMKCTHLISTFTGIINNGSMDTAADGAEMVGTETRK